MQEDRELQAGVTRHLRAGAVLMALLILAFPVYLLVQRSRAEAVKNRSEAALVAQGRKIWSDNCASCHGQNGEGGVGPALNSKQFLTTVTDGQMTLLISAGVPGAGMPTWSTEFGGPLTAEQIRAVVAFIRSWEAAAPDRPDWFAMRQPGLPGLQPAPTADLLSLGEKVFAANCASCHGVGGAGGVGPAFKGGRGKACFPKVEDQMNFVKQGTVGKKGVQYGPGPECVVSQGIMPGWAGILSDEQIRAVVEYVRSL